MDSKELRKQVESELDIIKEKMNLVLCGENLDEIEPILARIDATRCAPDWFHKLKDGNGITAKDGKTIGSILEKLLVCILEKYVLPKSIQLSVNPARGVDIPELELGIKSPSTNYCTSEPYFSAYERLLGNEYDAIILLTDFQDTKGKSNLELHIKNIKYLHGSEIADLNLCSYAKNIRDNSQLDDSSVKKLIRFLAYVNQSDWEAKRILELIDDIIIKQKDVNDSIKNLKKKYSSYNRTKKRPQRISHSVLEKLCKIEEIKPAAYGVICVAENWVIENQSDNGRFPNENEWRRFMKSPLNGKITMSFALQWRYNFSNIFNN